MDFTGIVVTTYSDTAVAAIRRFCNGEPCGTWFEFGPYKHAERITENWPDSVVVRFHDRDGRLEQYGQYGTCPPSRFDRIFGGECSGTTWSFDRAGCMTRSYTLDEDGGQVDRIFQPDGSLAVRKSRTDQEIIIEQWCPNGKRIGYMRMAKGPKPGEVVHEGTLIEWSIARYTYYAHSVSNGVHRLRKLPHGRWRRSDEDGYEEYIKALQLERIVYDDPERPVHLPCSLKRR